MPAALALAALVAVDACYLEPHGLLRVDRVTLDLGPAGRPSPGGLPATADRLRIVHLSDLHIRSVGQRERRLVARVAAERPQLVAISGDLVADTPSAARLAARTEAAAAVIAELRQVAPVVAVQGHSDHVGATVGRLARAGIDWLSNDGRLLPDGTLLLGVNQQVGHDLVPGRDPPAFSLRPVAGPGAAERDFTWTVAPNGRDNLYSHFDPAFARATAPPSTAPQPTAPQPTAPQPTAPQPTAPPSRRLGDLSGALSWSSYEVRCTLRIDDRDTAIGVVLHSRYPAGEDRHLRLRRVPPRGGRPGTFFLVANGSGFTAGKLDTGVEPRPGRWYRLRIESKVTPDAVTVRAKIWPAGEGEPAQWQAWGEDRSASRVTAGTVGLWAGGRGRALYRDLEVIGEDGTVLLASGLSAPPEATGFHDGTRASRLALALARSPAAPEPTRRLLLTHAPEVAVEAAHRGIGAVLAGHTHGGQIRMPDPFAGSRPLLTRSALGPAFDRGLFHLANPDDPRGTRLYINPGVGTSVLPIRFLCPPRIAVVTVVH